MRLVRLLSGDRQSSNPACICMATALSSWMAASRFRFTRLPLGAAISGWAIPFTLVDQASRASVASLDDDWCCQYGLQSYVPMYEQSRKVAIPSETPVNRALWVVLTLWRRQGGGFIRQAVVESDYNMLNETQIVLGELVIPEMTRDVTVTPVTAFDNGFMLDRVELPAAVRAGDKVNIRFVWRSNAAGDEDLAQFLHFAQAESDIWWGYDQQPLGARLPTRLWYDGLADSEVWQVPLPAMISRPVNTAVFHWTVPNTRSGADTGARQRMAASSVNALVPLGTLTHPIEQISTPSPHLTPAMAKKDTAGKRRTQSRWRDGRALSFS